MSFAWSEEAHYILSLYRPWQAEDSEPEAVVQAVEARLGISLPFTLRAFYRSWGKRDDMTRMSEYLLPVQRLFVSSDLLVFCIAQPGAQCWAIPLANIVEGNPPVHDGEMSAPLVSSDPPAIELRMLTHAHLSDFLDALTSHHAFCGGAVHGGHSREPADQHRVSLVRQQWRQVVIKSDPWGIVPSSVPPRWSLYVREGQMIDWTDKFWVAVQTTIDLDEISRALDITWEQQW